MASSTASASSPKWSTDSRRSSRSFRSWANKPLADFLQLLVAGLATGAIYALIAIGFTLLWQTSQTINFAQGEFVMLPAFFILIGTHTFGLPFWLAAILGGLATLLLLGLAFKKLMVDPMVHHGVLPLVIATIGLAILMKEAVREFYGADAWPFPALWATTDITLFGAVFAVQSLLILATCIVVVGALQFFLSGTLTGRCMQATAQNPAVARLLGIRVERMILYTFLINAALVWIAALLVTPIYLAKFTNGEILGLYAFIAAIIGGFNQVRGAIVGGLLLGVIDNFCAVYISSSYRMAVPLLILIVVILVRPQGLLGRVEERTV